MIKMENFPSQNLKKKKKPVCALCKCVQLHHIENREALC